MRAAALSLALLSGCAGVQEGSVPRNAQLTVNPELHGAGGNVWALLYASGQGFPGAPAVPIDASAASAVRVEAGDPHVVFSSVPPNVYRLWGFLDVDQNFDPQIDVLAQPGAGDRVGDGVEINVQPGKHQSFALDIGTGVVDEPPAFKVEGDLTDVVLAETPAVPTPVTLVTDALDGTFDARHLGFRVGLVDEDHNGVPDDLDGDGVPDLWPRAFMLWQPKPGQGDPDTQVLLPMVFNPAPFLTALSGNLSASLVVDRLQFGVLSQGTAITTGADGGTSTQVVASAPTGAYQLVMLTRTGQYWRIPNDLGAGRPSQAVNFHVDRNGR